MRGILIVFLGLTLPVFGQHISMRWLNDTVKVGEHAQLQITIKNKPANWEYRPLQGTLKCEIKTFKGNLWQAGGELEILDFKDTLLKKGNSIDYKGTYTLVAWDSAVYRVFPLWFVAADSTFSKPVPQLVAVFQKKKVEQGIEEIPVSFIDDSLSFLYKYWWMGMAIILLVLGAYFWNRRKKIKPQQVYTLRERTLLALGELKRKEDWLNGKEKAHYSAFSSILKSYIGVRYDLNLTERTTYETKLLLVQKGLNQALVKRIHDLLLEADMIKFAKQPADDLAARSAMRKLEELVTELSPLEIPK